MLCVSCSRDTDPNSQVCASCGAAIPQFKDNELSEVKKLCAAYKEYAKARSKLLSFLPRVDSCRDPLAEFSETLVAKLLCSPRAASPVQKGYDLVRPTIEPFK